MAGTTVPIAPIPLARSRTRLLAAPLLLMAAGVAAVAGGAKLGDAAGIVLVVGGIVVLVLAAYLALKLLSVRLDVEVATLRLRWLGGERRYTLVRGPVTRVALVGREAARLRPGFGALGWGLGGARLRRDEHIELVRLARTPTMILVPTDRGRVGVAPASEQQLLNALAAAARIQQRLDEVAERARAFVVAEAPARPVPAVAPSAGTAPAAEGAPASGRRVLTGIERTLLEERLAAERAAALRAAEAERKAAAEAASLAAAVQPAEAVAPVPPAPARLRRRGQWRRPTWFPSRRASAPAAVVAQAAPAAVRPMPVPMPVPRPMPRPRPAAIPADRLATYAVAVLPAIAAGIVWGVAGVIGRLELPAEQLRTVAVALLAAGPAGALAGLVARIWFPRLQGVVALTSLAALALVGRALLG